MRRAWPTGLRARLLITTMVGSLLAVGVLVATFNLVLDARLRGELDSLLRDRASAQLRTLAIVDGRLSLTETPDKAAPDTQTWIFAGQRVLEEPALPSGSGPGALALRGAPRRFLSVKTADARLYALPIVQESRRLGTVVVGASLRPYQSSAHAALVGSIILGALTVLGILAVSIWVVGRALAPVARMTAAAAEWGEHDLSRRFLVGEPHDELSELAATFDRLLDRLSQSLKREQRFTAEISHELRTPLARILAEAELAATDRRSAGERTPERYRRALESIRASAESLGRSLEVLLATARAETPARPPSSDAQTAAEHAAESGRSLAGERAVAVGVERSSVGLRVAVEPDLIERALAPLVENAVRFARAYVQIAVRAEDNRVIFEVNDDGPGVAAAIRERIFEPGVSENGGGGGSGAGLGLPLARRLAQAAGGEIRCLRAAGGASFALSLPAAPSSDVPR